MMAQFPAGGVFKGFTANSCLHSQSLLQNYRLESLKLSNVGQGHQNKPIESLLSGIMKEIILAAARANWKANLGESRGIPGRDFRCR